MTKEKLEVYNLKGKFLKVMDRKIFYQRSKQRFLKFGKISEQVKIIRLILMNSKGMIYIQKRSNLKKENAGLYDKTIGGHVSLGYTWEVALVKECAEELGFPIAVLKNSDFIIAARSVDLSVVGVAREIDCLNNFKSTRITTTGKVFFSTIHQ